MATSISDHGESAMSYDLQGKVALITGASQGLGSAIAKKLGHCHAKVAINYLCNTNKAKGVKNHILQFGGIADIFQADITDEKQVIAVCQRIREIFGDIEILVINATGPQPMINIEDLSWQDMLDQLHFFVKSPLLLASQVIGSMKQNQYGRIIHIGSEMFDLGTPGFSSYVSAKGAQLGLTRSWAKELAPHQITVNLVSPGWIPTQRHDVVSQASKNEYARAVPMGHMGEPDDVAETVTFLASDQAKFITGQKIAVNGGNTII